MKNTMLVIGGDNDHPLSYWEYLVLMRYLEKVMDALLQIQNLKVQAQLMKVTALLRYANAISKSTAQNWAKVADIITIKLEDGQQLVIYNSGDIVTDVRTVEHKRVAEKRITTSQTPVTGYIIGGIQGEIPFSGMLTSIHTVELTKPGYNSFQTNLIEVTFKVGEGDIRTVTVNTSTYAVYVEHQECDCFICQLANPPFVNLGETCSVKGPHGTFVLISAPNVTLTPAPAG